MPGFDVLSRDFSVQSAHFIEASAGTGKTFAIENLYARFLIEGVEIAQILVVTFTRAATAELKERIYAALSKILDQLEKRKTSLDYIQAILERGDRSVEIAKKRVRQALFSFDESKIFTIHGFCFQMLQENALEGDVSFDVKETPSLKECFGRVVKDFFRTAMTGDEISPGQLQHLLKHFRNDLEDLISEMLSLLSRRLPIVSGAPFRETYAAFVQEIQKLRKKKLPESAETVFEDLSQLAPCFKNMTDRQRVLKEEVVQALKNFSQFFEKTNEESFDRFLGEDVEILCQMHSENRTKKPLPSALHHPHLLEEVQERLFPLLQRAIDPQILLGRLAEGARALVENYISEEEIFFFEDILKLMEARVSNSSFAQKTREKFRAVLIDEFQDTDPAQWAIFSKLFANSSFSGFLYLVGDPKQSIYRFRNADIYTYLKAKEALGESAAVSLNVNYRSTPSLVSGLNALFSPLPDFFSLPQLRTALSCPSVQASALPGLAVLNDERKSIHFFQAEEESAFFSFIVNECKRLHRDQGVPYGEIAILVKDRFQAQRFRQYCDSKKLPTVSLQGRSLMRSPALPLVVDLLQAVDSPKDGSHAGKLLCGTLVGWDLEELASYSQREEEIVKQLYKLKRILQEEGLVAFFLAFLQTHLKNRSVLEDLLAQEAGRDLYSDLLQLIELAAHEENVSEGYLLYFQKFAHKDDDDEKLRARNASNGEAVSVLTLHMSKGLEFEIVFPLGLILKTPPRREWIADLREQTLKNYEPHQKEYLNALLELDAEKMRLFYVAATRAKRRLYLPVLERGSKEISAGAASPMDLFLQKRFQDRSLLDSLGECSEWSFSRCTDQPERDLETSEQKRTLIAPSSVTCEFRPIFVQSFTSLAPEYKEQERVSREKSLPSGMETGILLHKIFEKLPFVEAFRAKNGAALKPLLLPFIQNTSLEPYAEAVADVIYQTFNSSLLDKPSFSLAQVDPKKMIKEMEFLYPREKGFLKGFIDLFFEYEGKYYFLDWKSNDLEDYALPFLQQAMEEHHYLLQAEIYRDAVQRYVTLFDPRPFEECFGGSFYLFIRGMNMLSGERRGIFYESGRV